MKREVQQKFPGHGLYLHSSVLRERTVMDYGECDAIVYTPTAAQSGWCSTVQSSSLKCHSCRKQGLWLDIMFFLELFDAKCVF